MKTANDLKPEYDFSSMSGSVKGKYVERFKQGVNIVKIDDDLLSAFPDAKAVNDALRSLVRLASTKIKHA